MDKEKELERNAGIRKREQELEKKRKQRIHKLLALLGVVILLGIGAYMSRIAYTDLSENEEQTAIAVDSMYLEPPTEEDTAAEYIQQAKEELERQEALTAEEDGYAMEEALAETESDAGAQTLEDDTSATDIAENETGNTDENVQTEGAEEYETTAPAKEAVPENQYTCISSVNVNMRSKPSATASVVGKVYPKAVVTVLDQDTAGWYHISYNGLDGYVVSTVLKKES